MFRSNQTIENLFIRVEGWLYQLFGLFKKFFAFLTQVLASVAKVLGFTKLEYYLESDDAQTIKRSEIKQPTEAEVSNPQSGSANPRRRPDPQMDYYRNLARKVNSSS